MKDSKKFKIFKRIIGNLIVLSLITSQVFLYYKNNNLEKELLSYKSKLVDMEKETANIKKETSEIKKETAKLDDTDGEIKSRLSTNMYYLEETEKKIDKLAEGIKKHLKLPSWYMFY